MNLFAAAEGISSGPVPREVWPGIVWGDAEEALFEKAVLAWIERFPVAAKEPKARSQHEQTCRWEIERELLRATIDKEVEAASRCYETVEKIEINRRWIKEYGAEVAAAIVKAVKGPRRRAG